MPPSPWSTCTSDPASWLTWSGVSAAKSGLNPLKSTVRSSAGAVRDIGIRVLSASGDPAVSPLTRARKRCPITFWYRITARVVSVTLTSRSTWKVICAW